MVALAIEADDEHGASVAIAVWLVRRKAGHVSPLGSRVADALAKTTVTELVSTTKEFDRVVGIVGSEGGLHRPKVLVAKGQNVRPHAKRV